MGVTRDFGLLFAKDHLAALGLPPDFDKKLLRDDDWSLVIKLHALVEAALTNALVAHVGVEGTRDVFSRLQVGGRTGKVAFAKALDFSDTTEIRFVQALSELRNKLVHNVRNVNFKLKNHIESLSVSDRRMFVRNLCYMYVQDEKSTKSLDDAVKQVLARPKKALWRSGLQVIAVLYLQLQLAHMQRETTLTKAKVAEAKHPPLNRLLVP